MEVLGLRKISASTHISFRDQTTTCDGKLVGVSERRELEEDEDKHRTLKDGRDSTKYRDSSILADYLQEAFSRGFLLFEQPFFLRVRAIGGVTIILALL